MEERLLRNPMVLLLMALCLLAAQSSPAGAADRSEHVVIKNQTSRDLVYVPGELSHGCIRERPPSRINRGGTGELVAESCGFMTGTEGFAIYRLEGVPGEARFDFDNPWIGDNSYRSSAPGGFVTAQVGGEGNRTVVFFFIRGAGQPAARLNCNPEWIINHLGVQAEDRLDDFDRSIGFLSTRLKELGISGWAHTGCFAEATGRPERDAQHSTDGFWTIDVHLSGFVILNKSLSADNYVRIEVEPGTSAHAAVEARPPRENEMIHFTGEVLIDLHHGDELIEVHPRDPILHGDMVPGQIFVDGGADVSGNGSPQIPFNQLGEGVDAAGSGDAIFIKPMSSWPGSYPPITVAKRVSLAKWPGTAGSVVIKR
jgi:hypothetical protein